MRYALFLLAFLGNIQAANYYLNCSTGSDANSGAIGAPWYTAMKFVSVAVAGDTLFIRGGNCRMANADTVAAGPIRRFLHVGRANDNGTFIDAASGTVASPIVVRNYPGETVYIDSAADTTSDGSLPSIYFGSLAVGVSNWIIKGLNLRGNGVYIGSGLSLGTRVKRITLDSMDISLGRYILFENQGAVLIDRGDDYGPDSITIQHCSLHDWLVKANGKNYDWNDSAALFAEDHACLTMLDAVSYGGTVGTGRIVFRGNTCYNMFTGLYGKNPSSGPFVADSNTFYSLNNLGRWAGSGGTWKHNLIRSTAGGLKIGGYGGAQNDTTYAISGVAHTFQYNTFVGVGNALQFLEHGDGHTIERNVFSGLGAVGDAGSGDTTGVMCRCPSDAAVQHNDPSGTIRNSEWYTPGSIERNNCMVPTNSGYTHWSQLMSYFVRRKFPYSTYVDSLVRGQGDSIRVHSQSADALDSIYIDPVGGDYRLEPSLGCPVAGILADTSAAVVVPPVARHGLGPRRRMGVGPR